jgi:hypothetical protein
MVCRSVVQVRYGPLGGNEGVVVLQVWVRYHWNGGPTWLQFVPKPPNTAWVSPFAEQPSELTAAIRGLCVSPKDGLRLVNPLCRVQGLQVGNGWDVNFGGEILK